MDWTTIKLSDLMKDKRHRLDAKYWIAKKKREKMISKRITEQHNQWLKDNGYIK